MNRIEAITPKSLDSFLKTHLSSRSFTLFIHILTNPFISILCSIPDNVKKLSSIYLDGEKNKINNYAVRKLLRCGYKNVFYVNRLHAKLLVTEDFILVGSANYSERSLSNYEVIIVIWKNYREIPGLVRIMKDFKILADPAWVRLEEDKYVGKLK